MREFGSLTAWVRGCGKWPVGYVVSCVGQSVSNQGVSIRLRVYGYACVSVSVCFAESSVFSFTCRVSFSFFCPNSVSYGLVCSSSVAISALALVYWARSWVCSFSKPSFLICMFLRVSCSLSFIDKDSYSFFTAPNAFNSLAFVSKFLSSSVSLV